MNYADNCEKMFAVRSVMYHVSYFKYTKHIFCYVLYSNIPYNDLVSTC